MTTLRTLLLSTICLTGTAAAETTSVRETTPAPSNALELTLGTGLARGTGDLGDDLPAADDRAHSGLNLEASIGWRATRHLAIGAYLNLTGFGNPDDSAQGAFAGSAGIQATWHVSPAAAHDPWISLGTGVKVLALEDGDDKRTLTGVELARIQLGVDYRLSPRFAIGPVIAASASLFDRQYIGDSDDAMELHDQRVNWTFSAGVLARFDTL